MGSPQRIGHGAAAVESADEQVACCDGHAGECTPFAGRARDELCGQVTLVSVGRGEGREIVGLGGIARGDCESGIS